MNPVINSVPESVPGPKIGSGSEQSGTVSYGCGSGPGPGKNGTMTCSNDKQLVCLYFVVCICSVL